MELDLGAVRAFVAVADDRHFGEAAARLGLSQQAISKRIARLESELGTVLFHRSRAGARLTEDGTAFLDHARALIGTADRAVEAVRGRRGALRVDVVGTRLATVDLVRDFHQTTGLDVEIVTSNGLASSRPALTAGSIDAAFARSTGFPADAIEQTPACLDPAQLLVGRRHRYARRKRIPMAELATATVWGPSNAGDSEWAEFYRILSAEFGVRIDTRGPDFGFDHLVTTIAASDDLMSIIGEKLLMPWNPDVVRIPIVEPTPVYPHSLLWSRHNRHPALPRLLTYIRTRYRPYDPGHQWLPEIDRAAFTR